MQRKIIIFIIAVVILSGVEIYHNYFRAPEPNLGAFADAMTAYATNHFNRDIVQTGRVDLAVFVSEGYLPKPMASKFKDTKITVLQVESSPPKYSMRANFNDEFVMVASHDGIVAVFW